MYKLKVVDKKELCNQDAIVLNLIKINKYKVAIYGAGNAGYSVSRQLEMYDIDVELFIDNDEKKAGETIRGKKVYHTSQAGEVLKTIESYYIIIAMDLYSRDGKVKKEIDDFLQTVNAVGIHQILFFDRSFAQFDKYILTHEKEIDELREILGDIESKETLDEWLRVLIQADCYLLNEHQDRYKYWGCDFNGNDELFQHLKEEVFVNCGSCIGDTIFKYIAKGYEFKKIYAFEGDNKTFLQLERNIQLLDSKYKNKIELYNEFIGENSNSFDERFATNKITFINADIEGNELDVLHGMQRIISEQEPVVAFCIYHKCDDFIEIPKFILQCNSDYQIYFRKYVSNIRSKAELVMYAVPNKRCLKK